MTASRGVKVLELELPQKVLTKRLAAFIGEFCDGPAFPVPTAVLAAIGRAARLPVFLGFDNLDFDGAFGAGARNIREIFHLQHDVLFECVLDLRAEVENRELQQANGLHAAAASSPATGSDGLRAWGKVGFMDERGCRYAVGPKIACGPPW